jgi:post-segregation antitoxin (ccd killing protein)
MSDMEDNLEENVRKMREALTVTSAMALRNETRAKEHQEWLEEQQAAIARHQAWLEEHEAVMRRVDDKLERIADLILRGRGENGHGGEGSK